MALSVALLLGGVALDLVTGSAVPDLPSGGETDDSNAVSDLILLLTFSVVGAIVASRRPRNAIGWIFCSVGMTIGLNSFVGDYAEFWLARGFGTSDLGETAAWLSSWLWTLLFYFPTSLLLLLFPDGRLPSPRWRPVAWGVALGTVGGVVGNALKAGPLVDFPQIANPYGVDSPVVWVLGVAGAALFNPLRFRIQSFIDRRFYRRKYDAARTLEGFSAKLRDKMDLDGLNADLVTVVRETMQPEHVSLWLRPDTTSEGRRAN